MKVKCPAVLVRVLVLVCAGLVAPGLLPAEETLVGTVVDSRGPVSGAAVSVEGGEESVVTGDDGRFRLSVEPPVRLQVQHPAFSSAYIDVAEAGTELRIELVVAEEVSETLLVTAERLGDRYSPNSISSFAFDPIERPSIPSNLADAVVHVAGVSENGQGGLFQTISIRGTSRQRVLSLFSGVRLTSERRAGVSASFIDPTLLGEVEVLRGPASTYYGSGALGGVVRLQPRRFQSWSAQAGYESQGASHFQQVGWGGRRLSLGVARRSANDAKAASGESLFSRFDQLSATSRARFGQSSHAYDLDLAVSQGSDIGKASSDFPERTTLYPRERHVLVRFAHSTPAWRMSAYVHPHDLDTEVTVAGRQEVTLNDTLDFGARFAHELNGTRRLAGRFGVELFGRNGVDAASQFEQVPTDNESRVQSLDDASEEELAAFAITNWQWGRTRWEVGGRATRDRQRAGGLAIETGTSQRSRSATSDRTRSRSALTGFLGFSVAMTERLQALATVGTGVRFPSLSERFFVGATGRGIAVGNPELDSEEALNSEVGLRWHGNRTYGSASVFRHQIDDYIERIELEPGLFGFRNLLSGTLEGFEAEGYVDFLGRMLRASLAVQHVSGSSRADGGTRLADVPPDELRLSARWMRGRWQCVGELRLRGDKDELGPSERAISAAQLVDTRVSLEVREGLELSLTASNLLDERYFRSADDRAPLAAGRAIGVVMRWRQQARVRSR